MGPVQKKNRVICRAVVNWKPQFPFSVNYYRYDGKELIEVINPYKYPHMNFVWKITEADKWMAEKDDNYIDKAIDVIIEKLRKQVI